MTPEQEKFLDEIAAELKTQPGLELREREEVFFPLRYDKNRPVTFQHLQIAQELMPQDPRIGRGDYATSIGTTEQNVVRAIVNLYQEEMEQDRVNINIFLNGQKRPRGSWREIYHWLWKHKYLRWLDKNGWQILQEKAMSATDWIQFKSQQEMASAKRAPKRRPPPASAQKVASKIPAHEALLMEVNLAYSNYQLLLFNRSAEGQYLLCPSLEFAPNGMIDKPPILLPQQGSYADDYDEKENFTFEVIGQEEFLAIVLEKPLKLDWLTPREEDSLPECNGKRFKELFDELEQQENWQVFYQSFQVVETV